MLKPELRTHGKNFFLKKKERKMEKVTLKYADEIIMIQKVNYNHWPHYMCCDPNKTTSITYWTKNR